MTYGYNYCASMQHRSMYYGRFVHFYNNALSTEPCGTPRYTYNIYKYKYSDTVQ